MKFIKNKRRFDPRWHHSERLESKEQDLSEIDEIKVNFNSFNLDTWLEEEDKKREEYGETKPKRSSEDEKALDDEMRDLKNREIRRGEHPLVEDPIGEMCGEPHIGPEEPEAAIADLSPDDAFNAGYTAAVEEIMASIQGLLEDPVDMVPPEEMAIDDDEMVVQLPDHAMEMHEEESTGDSYMVKLNLTKEQWEALELETKKKVASLMGTTRSTSGDGSIERAVGFVETWQDMGFTDEHIQVFENGNEILISDIVEDPTGHIDQALMLQQTL